MAVTLARPHVYFGYRDADTSEPRQAQPKQALAHATIAEELFYGGAAGGGKSEWLIVEAIKTCLEHPRVEVALFRRTRADLERSLVTRFRELVKPELGRFNQGHARGEFKNGSYLWFCYCEREAHVYNYQSAQWIMLGIDEASHFTDFQANYLGGRVRTTRKSIRKKVRLTSNPGNRGHGWLKERYVRPGGYELGDRPLPAPFQIWRPHPPLEKPWVIQRTRQFIPARLQDNPALMENDPNYLSTLYLQHGAMAAQLAEGDWDSWDGALLDEWKATQTVKETDTVLLAQGARVGQVLPWHVLDRHTWRPPPGAKIYGSVDYGFAAPWAFYLTAVLPDGHLRTFFELYQSGLRDSQQAQRIKVALETVTCDDGSPLPMPEWILLEPLMWASREESGVSKSIAEVYQDVLGRVPLLKGAAGRGARVRRVQRWKDALSTAPDGWPWWTCTTACRSLIKTVPNLPRDEHDPEVEDDKAENHAYESLGRMFEARPEIPKVATKDPYEGLDPLSRQFWEERDRAKKPTRGLNFGNMGGL